jgi:hypothetical protein
MSHVSNVREHSWHVSLHQSPLEHTHTYRNTHIHTHTLKLASLIAWPRAHQLPYTNFSTQNFSKAQLPYTTPCLHKLLYTTSLRTALRAIATHFSPALSLSLPPPTHLQQNAYGLSLKSRGLFAVSRGRRRGRRRWEWEWRRHWWWWWWWSRGRLAVSLPCAHRWSVTALKTTASFLHCMP